MSTQAKPDYYQLLGVSRTATEQDIRSAFEKLASAFKACGKPRNSGDVEEMRAIATAYRVLSDGEKRSRYDRSGHGFIGDSNNQLAGPGRDKLDDVLRRFEDLYKKWGSSDISF